MEQVHTPDEYLPVDRLGEAYRLLHALLRVGGGHDGVSGLRPAVAAARRRGPAVRRRPTRPSRSTSPISSSNAP